MILGLYILSPILSGWIQSAPIRDIEYFIVIWAAVSFLQFLTIDSILFDYLRYFTGAIGYFILGYYLTIKDNHLLKDVKFGAILFIVGSLITIIGTLAMSFITHDQSLFFIKLGDLTPGACLQGIGLFIVISNTSFDGLNERINDFAVKVSMDSYGIYLCNILVINFLEMLNLIHLKGFTLLMIIIYAVIVLLICFVVIEIMGKFKILRMFSGKS
jgi:surface polysaccharide O-acyltransferase-like enzyme